MEIFSGKGALYVGSKAKQPLERIPSAFAFVFVSKWRRNPVAWAREGTVGWEAEKPLGRINPGLTTHSCQSLQANSKK